MCNQQNRVMMTRHYDVPGYRMRNLARRLDALIPHVEEHGRHLSYDISESIRMYGLDGHMMFPNAPKFLMDAVTIQDDIRTEGFELVAVMDRKEKPSLMPIGDISVYGEVVPILWRGDRNGVKPYEQEPEPDLVEAVGDDWARSLSSTCTCGRCGHKVGNGVTYLVMEDGKDDPIQVGGCCVSRYAGGLPSQHVRCYMDILSQAHMFAKEEQIRALPMNACLVKPERMVAYALNEMRNGLGYERWNASEHSSTALKAMTYARSTLMLEEVLLPNSPAEVTSNLLSEATDAVAWARDGFSGMRGTPWKEATSEILRNAPDGFVEARHRETVTAIAEAWVAYQGAKSLFADASWLNPAGSRWLGTEGGRIQTRVVKSFVLSRRLVSISWKNMAKTLYGLLTEDGNAILWETTKPSLPDMSFENPRKFIATVTSHIEYQGHMETMVTNGRFGEDHEA